MKTRPIFLLIVTVVLASCESREISGSWSNDSAINAGVYGSAQTPTPQPPALDPIPVTSIKFESYSYDFGKVEQNTEYWHTFSYRNTGNHPLIIEMAKGNCGCITPIYKKEPIAPGDSGTIKLRYRTGEAKHERSHYLTITTNTEPKNTVLNMQAFIE